MALLNLTPKFNQGTRHIRQIDAGAYKAFAECYWDNHTLFARCAGYPDFRVIARMDLYGNELPSGEGWDDFNPSTHITDEYPLVSD